jgi:hypothetical protein
MRGLLVSDKTPTATTRLSLWLDKNKQNLGVKYQSELKIHYLEDN